MDGKHNCKVLGSQSEKFSRRGSGMVSERGFGGTRPRSLTRRQPSEVELARDRSLVGQGSNVLGKI